MNFYGSFCNCEEPGQSLLGAGINWNVSEGSLSFNKIRHPFGIVAEVVFETSFPLSPIALGDAFDLSLAEDVEAVHECDADVDFGGLAVGVS